MCEKELLEDVYRELLKDIRDAIKAVKKLSRRMRMSGCPPLVPS